MPSRIAIAVAVTALILAGGRLSSQAPGPPYSPADALRTFRLADGFQIETFASEPLVTSPVAMEVDERGRLFVVEMPGYPLDVGGSGRVVMLEDTDRDGKPDRRTVFAEGLRLPAGIMAWKQGVIVTDSPQVWYLEDTNNDGRADVKRELLTGFALTNPQHTTNSPIYGLDNWIYLANEGPVRTIRYRDIFGDAGGEVRFPDRPGGPRLPPDADGRNVRFRPDTYELEMLSARSQFGQTFDAWGHHFDVTNNRHMFQEVLAARYIARNPSLLVSSAVEQVPDYKLPAEVFPITANPEFQLLTDVGVMTSASGLTWYLGDLFPDPYRSVAFVAEGAHNLVHAASIREHGVTFRASRLFDGREFLASTDAWFRPVNLYVGPDGALYLIDYYRKVLEHPEWLDDATARSGDLTAGRDRGRIYRITPAAARGTKPPAPWLNRIRLDESSAEDLVRTLAHPNIWWRRHAQRLLVDRHPAAAVLPLAQRATASNGPAEGRVHALWTLQGMHRLTATVIERALLDPSPGVRENAIRLAELHVSRIPTIAASLLKLVNDPDLKVRFQLLLTLGAVDTPEAAAGRSRLLFEHADDDWMQLAGLSASGLDPGALFREAVAQLGDRETPGRRLLFSRIASMAAASPGFDRTHGLVSQASAPGTEASAWWRAAALEGVATGLTADRRRSAELDTERAALIGLLQPSEPAPVRRASLRLLEAIGLPAAGAAEAVSRAGTVAADPRQDPDARADAVRLLALADAASHVPVFREILTRAEPLAVHLAAVRAWAEPRGEAVANAFVELWSHWTPAVRDEALRLMVRDPARVKILLDAVGAGAIRTSEIAWPLRVRMMMSDDDGLRSRARTFFGEPVAATETIRQYRPALDLAGDPQRGRQVFTRACAACHQYRGAGGAAFGPDLAEARSHLPGSLLADILNPNQSIADGYELWIAQLADGSTATGIISSETPSSVTFRRPGATDLTLARAQIASMRIAELSAMPRGLEAQIDQQQMADLIAFIRGGK